MPAEALMLALMSRTPPDPDKAGDLGINVRKFRKAAGWTQDQLGARAGVSRLTVSNIERGVYEEPKRRVIRGLARALGVSEIDLMNATVGAEESARVIEEFGGTPLAASMSPPVQKEELAWLKALPVIAWAGSRPTPQQIYFAILSHRSKIGRKNP